MLPCKDALGGSDPFLWRIRTSDNDRFVSERYEICPIKTVVLDTLTHGHLSNDLYSTVTDFWDSWR